jgi:subtilisin family serine protease
MKKIFLSLLLAMILYSNAQNNPGYVQPGEEYAFDRLVVKLKESAVGSAQMKRANNTNTFFHLHPALALLNETYRCTHSEKLLTAPDNRIPRSLRNVFVLHFENGIDIHAAIKEYEATGLFDRVTPDYIGYAHGTVNNFLLTPNDQYFAGRQWSLNNNGTFAQANVTAKAGADAKMLQAWDITTGDTSTVVAIIDSGNKLDHPEFSGRIWINYDEIPGNNIDDDGNGFIDDYRGWDFVNNDNTPADDNGHGTNVTGIIGATGNNSTLYAGMNWKCKLMIIKAFAANGSYLATNIVKAVQYAVDNGAKVINFSGGANGADPNLKAELDNAFSMGVLFVASNGNNNNSTPQYPASWADKNSSVTHLMTVGATNVDDSRCNPFNNGGGSNYGNWTSVVAPGNYIYSVSYNSNTGSSSINGTSQAAPHATGLASLLLAVNVSYGLD